MRSGHGIMKTQVALPEGYLLHHYRLAKVLGVGGFSIVYLAVDTRSHQRVVVKEYMPSNQATRRDGTTVEALTGESTATFRVGIKRFFEEAAALAKDPTPQHRARDRLLPRQQHRLHGDALRVGQGICARTSSATRGCRKNSSAPYFRNCSRD